MDTVPMGKKIRNMKMKSNYMSYKLSILVFLERNQYLYKKNDTKVTKSTQNLIICVIIVNLLAKIAIFSQFEIPIVIGHHNTSSKIQILLQYYTKGMLCD